MQKLLVCIFAFTLCLTANARPDGGTPPAVTSTQATVTTLATPTAAPNTEGKKTTNSPALVTPDNSSGNNKVPGSPGANGAATAAPPAPTSTADTASVTSPKPTVTATNPPTGNPVTTPGANPASPPTTPKPASSSTKEPTSTKEPPSTKEPTSTKAPAATTEHAKNASTPPPVVAARGFDGASFIGGIVLALGLLAVGFMGFKYYKTQTERNYHTL